MPSTSPEQQRIFGMALAVKRGKSAGANNPAAKRIAETLSAQKIKEFASTRGLKK